MTDENKTTSSVSETFRSMLLHGLHNGVMRVVFLKKDGTERTMVCTLMETVLPVRSSDGETRKSSPDAQCVWDIEANGWRSFRWDSVRSFEPNLHKEILNGN